MYNYYYVKIPRLILLFLNIEFKSRKNFILLLNTAIVKISNPFCEIITSKLLLNVRKKCDYLYVSVAIWSFL